VGNFLNMPQSGAGGASAGARSTAGGARSPSAGQLPSNGGTRSYTTQGGSTITVGGGSRGGTTAGGVNIGGAAGGVKVEGPGGNTAYRGSAAVGASKGDKAAIAGGSRSGIQNSSGAGAARGTSYRGATNGTDSAFRAGSATGARDAAGNSIANVRGGYADSSGYRQGGSITAARNQWGYTGVSARGGYGANGVGQIGSAGAIRGPGGNVIAGGRGASFVNGQFVGGAAWTGVNGAYTRWGAFGPGYYGNYPGAWFPGKWAIAGTAWATLGYAACGSYCGCSDEGMYYDYGGNITYDNDTVYYDDQPVASAEQYYNEANDIANTGQEATNEEWLPLGVYAVIAEPTQTETDKVVQIALNKEGVIRGNFHDFLTDKVTPITGAVNKETQRVALKLEGNDKLVVETGLYNLTNDEVPVLVHIGSDRQEARTFIRLKNPEDEK
jgi:hypothetical protein